MSDFFKNNLIYLRENANQNQIQVATALGLSRSTYANYETGANLPKADIMLKIIGHFNVSFENLMTIDLSKKVNTQTLGKEVNRVDNRVNSRVNYPEKEPKTSQKTKYVVSQMPKVVTVDEFGRDNIVHVPVKARAGYLLGYGDAEFIADLPAYKVPGLRTGTYRSFEVDGVSMTPGLQPQDLVIGEYVECLEDIHDDRVYVVVTKELGVVVKRLLNRIQERNKIYLKSDTLDYRDQYPTIGIEPNDILELWYCRMKISNKFSSPSGYYEKLNDASIAILELQQQQIELKQELDSIKKQNKKNN